MGEFTAKTLNEYSYHTRSFYWLYEKDNIWIVMSNMTKMHFFLFKSLKRTGISHLSLWLVAKHWGTRQNRAYGQRQ